MSTPESTDPERRPPIVPTSARGRRTRAKIVEAAREVFLDVGYAEANATVITASAGVSYGSFYVYFGSKSELFAEVAAEAMEQVYLTSRAPAAQRDPLERIATENERFFEVYRSNARIFQVLEDAIRTDEEFRDTWREMRRRNVARLARGLRRLDEQGVVKLAAPADLLADALGAMAERLAHLATVDDGINVERRLAALNAVWRRTLGIESP